MLNEDIKDSKISPESVIAEGFDIRKSVFIIPLDAPLPNELSSATVSSGNLYQRLDPLSHKELEVDFALVPLAGNELLALDRAWTTLVDAPRVYALLDIPGAKYDILFTQARRQLGIRALEWPVVADALAARLRTVQRTTDKQPWNLDADKQAEQLLDVPARKKYSGSNIDNADRTLEEPQVGFIDED